MNKQIQILIAEDEISLQYIVKMMLADYEIELVDNGKKLIEAAKANPPKLILTDVMMPVMSGEEAVKILKDDESLQHIPVIALSAKTHDSEIDQMLEHGFDDFISKPVRKQQLIEKIETFLK